MATGRRDYTYGFYQETVTIRRSGTLFKSDTVYPVGPGDMAEIYSYTVPEGYRLVLNGLHVTLPMAGLCWVRLLKNGGRMLYNWFTYSYFFNPGTYGGLLYDEGDKLTVEFMNGDEVEAPIYVLVLGVLEEKD